MSWASHDGQTPLARYPQDLPKGRSLGALAAKLDALFLHRVRRLVRQDGTVSSQGGRFEGRFELTGKTVCLRVDPHAETVVGEIIDRTRELVDEKDAARILDNSPGTLSV